ncbi:MAG: L-histidine N(alpha)-methyltransferase [Pseudomonadota bacterium]
MNTPENPCDTPFARDVLEGLAKPQKTIPSRWLYDELGSKLFEDITGLEEYYPTRTETGIFHAEAGAIAAAIGPRAVLVEYGAGALVKTRILLDALEAPAGYVPIDISGPFLEAASAALSKDYPGLPIAPVVADFTKAMDLSGVPGQAGLRVGFFPGSTLGNLDNWEIVAFFKAARASLGPEARFVLGVDLKKDPEILIPAYDDGAGVTAEFNLNLLTRLARELGAEVDAGRFAHEARWNPRESRIEMHLVAGGETSIQVCGARFSLAAGDSIRTEISRKFSLEDLDAVLAEAGWRREQTWLDAKSYFAVLLLGPPIA